MMLALLLLFPFTLTKLNLKFICLITAAESYRRDLNPGTSTPHPVLFLSLMLPINHY